MFQGLAGSLRKGNMSSLCCPGEGNTGFCKKGTEGSKKKVLIELLQVQIVFLSDLQRYIHSRGSGEVLFHLMKVKFNILFKSQGPGLVILVIFNSLTDCLDGTNIYLHRMGNNCCILWGCLR